MRKISVFNFITLNGFFKGPNGDINWHAQGAEESEYSMEGLKADHILMFGRITYEMMAGYWPTPDAIKNLPEVAQGMNKAEKIVFSRTLKKAEWNNTKIIRDNMVDEIRKIKNTPGKNLTLLGSGTILTQFAEAGLIDEYLIMVDPVAIGNGTPIFNGISGKLNLKLTGSRTFKSGVILLNYQQA